MGGGFINVAINQITYKIEIKQIKRPTPFILARAWTVFLIVSVGMISELSPVR